MFGIPTFVSAWAPVGNSLSCNVWMVELLATGRTDPRIRYRIALWHRTSGFVSELDD